MDIMGNCWDGVKHNDRRKLAYRAAPTVAAVVKPLRIFDNIRQGSVVAHTIFGLLANPPHSRWADATIADTTTQIRFGELANRVRRRAAALLDAGVQAGDRVLISCSNSTDWVVSTVAVMRAGGIAVPIDPGATAREIAVYEGIVEPAGVILDEDGDRTRFNARALTWAEPQYDISEATVGPVPRPEDRALIVFTSGTTGLPKAAVQRHITLVYAGQGVVQWLGLTAADRLLICMPLFHANAIYYSLMGGLCAGADLYIIPKFSVSRFWNTVRQTHATEVNLMGPILSMLLRQPSMPNDADNPLRIIYTAGSTPEVAQAFMKRFDVEVVEGYGMTETPYGCVNPREKPRWGSVGLPRRHPAEAFRNEVRIVGADGAPEKNGDVGEITIRNDATFMEYWNDPVATREAFHNGWLHTGDLGYCDDDGYVYIVGRAKEIIRRKGVNIAPAEIELVVRDIPDVENAALIGLPSPLGEELAILVVTLREGAAMEGIEDRILARLRTLISREKVPDQVVVVDDIPRTHTQRVERGKLRECLRQRVLTSPTAEHR